MTDIPGVRVTDEGPWGTWYSGTEDALVAAGIIRPEWMPGRGENNRSQQQVVVSTSGAARLIRGKKGWQSHHQLGPNETRLTIHKSTNGLRVLKHPSVSEVTERKRQEARRATEREAWDPDGFKSNIIGSLQRGTGYVFEYAAGTLSADLPRAPAHKLENIERVMQKYAELLRAIMESDVLPADAQAAVVAASAIQAAADRAGVTLRGVQARRLPGLGL